MINHTNIKSILIQSFLIIVPLFLISSCSQNKTVDSKDIAEQGNLASMETDKNTILVVENDNEATFLMEVAEMQLEEINLGKLAQQKGNNAHVKDLGKMMEKDHTKTLTELQALARSKSISIPASMTEDSKYVYENLNKKKDNDFGKAYSEMMVEHHENAIALFEKTSKDSDDTDIRNWASSKIEGLKTHLKHAQACKRECDKM